MACRILHDSRVLEEADAYLKTIILSNLVNLPIIDYILFLSHQALCIYTRATLKFLSLAIPKTKDILLAKSCDMPCVLQIEDI